MKRFGYWRDPLFLSGCVLYAMNRWLLTPHAASPFLHGQFNDCLIVPCALPLMLWLHRWLGLRADDRFPTFGEVALHVAVWSVLCEVVGPQFMNVTGDVKDVLAYATGGLMAWIWWHRETPLARCAV